MESQFLKEHEAGVEVMGRGSGVPDSLAALADYLESVIAPLNDGLPDSVVATLGRLLLNNRSQNAAIAEADCRYRAESLRANEAARISEKQAQAIRSLNRELEEARQALADEKACRAAASREASSHAVASREAEKRLAEYRASLANVPFRAARMFPAVAALGRAYLDDMEKESANG